MTAAPAMTAENEKPGGEVPRGPGGRHRRAAEVERRCLASGAVLPKGALIRFVVGPDGELVPDLAERLPGRGFWCLAERDMIEKARARNLFAKAAHTAVTLPDDLPALLETALRRRCLDIIGLARRAGDAVSGFEKTRSWLASGRARLLLEAVDSNGDGARKLRALAGAAKSELPLVKLFTAAELGQAFGRNAAVHAALAGGLAARLESESKRLAGVMTKPQASASNA